MKEPKILNLVFCERSYGKADPRKYHEMTHIGEKPHECELSGRRFVQPAALRIQETKSDCNKEGQAGGY